MSNIAASIKARLLSRARQTGDEFELFLVRYANERFLFRLGASKYRDQCILKGAALLTLWMRDPYRATRDLDLLAFGPNDEASVRALVRAVCAVPGIDDGVTFDLDSLAISPIRADEEYEGQRAVLRAYLGTARIRLQIDFGFGDVVTPGPEDSTYPTLLDGLGAPSLRTYPRVATMAEKFDAMVRLGRRNSRMKDFSDVWALSSQFEFEGPLLREAVFRCFERRGTLWTPERPDVLGSAFYGDDALQELWRSYTRRGAFRIAPPQSFETIGDRVRGFLGPVRDSIVTEEPLEMHWNAGGPWK